MATFFIFVALVLLARLLMVPGVATAGSIILILFALLGAIILTIQFIATPFGLLVLFLAICGAIMYGMRKQPEKTRAALKRTWENFRALSTKAKLGIAATILGIIAVVIATMG